mmetsp:Transcript_75576/g.196590  ORF Transcript_75576/g.196590 Transcript_75576/m.196590 type:complete len:241 (+) Transcript_75576:715-1437(+)
MAVSSDRSSSEVSSCFSAVSLSSCRQYASFLASAEASLSSFASMSAMSPRTFSNGSEPPALCIATSIFEASWANALEACLCPRSRTSRTTLKSVILLLDIWTNESWVRAVPFTSPLRSCFAFESDAISASLLFISDSKPSALDIHSWCNLPFASSSASNSFLATVNSPSELDFFSLAAAMPFLAASISFLEEATCSPKDVFSIAKLCCAATSLFRLASSWLSALSKRSCSTSTTEPLRLS